MAVQSNEVIHVAPPATTSVFACPMEATRAFGARIANIVLTAQVQAAYQSAVDARNRARRTATYIECVWPNTPLRTLVLGAYQAQIDAADSAASDVLAHARAHCGLAYTHG
jgi:hypothetical protein